MNAVKSVRPTTKTTVIVVGLLPGQAHQIERQCRGVRLRFVESQGNVPKLPSGDHIVLLIRFIRHLWTNYALAHWPRNRVHYHMGGLSSLPDVIKEIAGEATDF